MRGAATGPFFIPPNIKMPIKSRVIRIILPIGIEFKTPPSFLARALLIQPARRLGEAKTAKINPVAWTPNDFFSSDGG